jgi:hypothetical protein
MSTVLRLRPVVHATPTPTGVHVRGWASSFTVDGGAGVWKVWQWLAARLAEGVPAEDAAPPRNAPPAVTRAFEALIGQLREHDMLVELPDTWISGEGLPAPEIARWLEAVAADPAAAWKRIRAAHATVVGTGQVAAAAWRALAAGGIRVAPPVPGEGLVILAGDRHLAAGEVGAGRVPGNFTAVAGRCGADVGFVVAPGAPTDVLADSRAVTDRLAPDVATESPQVLAALVGGVAAHRILCAVAGLPDPAEEATTVLGDEPGEHPAVLVARLDPLRAEYHPWLSRRSSVTGPVDGLPAALRRLDVLCDPELGSLAQPLCEDLPQVPASLALAGGVLGIGTTADASRLDAALRAAEAGFADEVAVGVNARHAHGVALRRAAHAGAAELPSEAVPESEWATDTTARRWWKALTLRFAVPATVRVARLAPDVVHAEIHAGGDLLAWAVEATAADAVAFAALSATAVLQARAAGVDVADGSVILTGAAPAWLPENLSGSPWTGREWHWPAGLEPAEEALQAALRHLGPAPTAAEEDHLTAAGFAVVTVPSWATITQGARR